MRRDSSVVTEREGQCIRGLGGMACWAMVSWVGLSVLGCATTNPLSETPMSTSCLEVPSVEECRTAAAVIEDTCLRQCVDMQCSGIKVTCDVDSQQRCRELNEGKKSRVGGYVTRKNQTCQQPKDEVAWCQLPMPRPCRAKAMVHELAHSCGWHHDDGGNVPGGTGELQCK
jgi:hypothetical protein